MTSFVHPRLTDVPLPAALHALADEHRLAIVRTLSDGEEYCCTSALPGAAIPKSTLSNHFRILRAAGLVESRKAGREYANRLRREEFERRFPGLLAAVLRPAADGEGG